MRRRLARTRIAAGVLGAAACVAMTAPGARADNPQWMKSAVVYTIFPRIFSPAGNLNGVTAQLPRLKALGVTVVWLMPITPQGNAVNGHPSYDSPYCVQNYYMINPAYGTGADLSRLVATAHHLGIRVVLDEVLNHSSWDNPLIAQHPEFYKHSDGNPRNPASILHAFTFNDVAQLDYGNPGLRSFMTGMLTWWIKKYDVDGFRFDTADDPGGPGRMIPASFWESLGESLKRAKPEVLMIGESGTADLANRPFQVQYGWDVYNSIEDAVRRGDVRGVPGAWQHEQTEVPGGAMDLSLQDDWDENRDVNTFGGRDGALAMATFNFTNVGVPLLYNGMEIGNAAGAFNPRATIDWNSGAPEFPAFYRQLAALRRRYPALQQGAMTWKVNTTPSQVLTYTRSGAGQEFLIEINLSAAAAQGSIANFSGAGWSDVTPHAGAAPAHSAPPVYHLAPKGFAIFRRADRA